MAIFISASFAVKCHLCTDPNGDCTGKESCEGNWCTQQIVHSEGKAIHFAVGHCYREDALNLLLSIKLNYLNEPIDALPKKLTKNSYHAGVRILICVRIHNRMFFLPIKSNKTSSSSTFLKFETCESLLTLIYFIEKILQGLRGLVG